jgi:hypothetical protein
LAPTLAVLILASLASVLIYAFPAPFGGEAVRQLKVIGAVTVFLVVVVGYFLTCFILMFIGTGQAREA